MKYSKKKEKKKQLETLLALSFQVCSARKKATMDAYLSSLLIWAADLFSKTL
jgi:hypothetical protein